MSSRGGCFNDKEIIVVSLNGKLKTRRFAPQTVQFSYSTP